METKIRVLIADPGEDVRALLTDLLTREEDMTVAGYAADGTEALDRIRELDVSSATKADYAPAPVEETPEPEPTATPSPSGEVYSIDGVVYVNGVPVDPEATQASAS